MRENFFGDSDLINPETLFKQKEKGRREEEEEGKEEKRKERGNHE